MKKLLYKWCSILLPLLLGIGLVAYKYNDFTPAQMQQMRLHFRNADYFFVGLSLFIALFGFISRAYRWKYTLGYLGYQPSFSNKLLAVCISYFVNLTIPRSGELTRAIVVNKYENIPFDKAFGTIVAERVVDLLLFFLFVVLALLFECNTLSNYLLSKTPLDLVLSFFAILAFFSFLIVWAWKYSKWKAIQWLKSKIAGLVEGIFSIWRMPGRRPFLYHSLFIWATYLLMFYVMIFAMPETSSIGFGAVLMAFIFGSVAVGFTNSGFGAYPVLVGEILVLYGVDNIAGNALGWLIWISQTLLIVILGTASFLLLPFLNRNKSMASA